MALTAQAIITRVGRALKDSGHDQWTEPELLEYISDAQRSTVLLKPESNPVYRIVSLEAGVRQQLPADAHQLIAATMNIDADDMPDDAITPATRASLDDSDRNWAHSEPDPIVRNVVYDVKIRRHFYVSPPQPGTNRGKIEIYVSKIPAELAAASSPLELDDIYLPALFAYTMHRAHMKDVDEEGQSVARANAYFEQFVTLLLGREDRKDDITVRHELTEKSDN